MGTGAGEMAPCKISLKVHSKAKALMWSEVRSRVCKQGDLKNWKFPGTTKLIRRFVWVLFSFCFE